MLDELLLSVGVKEGIFAILFMWLLHRTTKQAENREEKLYTFLDDMRGEFAKLVGSYESLAEDVADIKSSMIMEKHYLEKEGIKNENSHIQ